MKNEFIPYKQALILKELGFDEPCLAYWQGGKNEEPTMMCNQGTIYISRYNYFRNTFEVIKDKKIVREKRDILVTAPTNSMAFRWFRKKHKLMASIDISDEGTEDEHYFMSVTSIGMYGHFDTYEEAELACLDKLIEIVKKK